VKALFALFDVDKSNDLSMHEIKYAICAGRNLDDRLWLQAVNSGFDERNIHENQNTSADISSILAQAEGAGKDLTTTAIGGPTAVGHKPEVYTMDTEIDFDKFDEIINKMFNMHSTKKSKKGAASRTNMTMSASGVPGRTTTSLKEGTTMGMTTDTSTTNMGATKDSKG
jgi:hypothetical protein